MYDHGQEQLCPSDYSLLVVRFKGQMNFPKPSLPSNERSSRPVATAVEEPVRNGGTTNGTGTSNQVAAGGLDLAPPPPGFQQVNP